MTKRALEPDEGADEQELAKRLRVDSPNAVHIGMGVDAENTNNNNANAVNTIVDLPRVDVGEVSFGQAEGVSDWNVPAPSTINLNSGSAFRFRGTTLTPSATTANNMSETTASNVASPAASLPSAYGSVNRLVVELILHLARLATIPPIVLRMLECLQNLFHLLHLTRRRRRPQ
jgi:hypothetical protein